MAHPKWIRFVEPLFPVVLIAAGVALAPAFLLSGGTSPASETRALAHYVGAPIVVNDAYVGCGVAGNVYSANLVPAWRCGHESVRATVASREVASTESRSGSENR